MSFLDQQYPQQQPYYSPPPPPQPHKAKRSVGPYIVMAVCLVVVLAVGVIAFTQHAEATEARADLASTKADLKDTEGDLETAETDLHDSQESLADTESLLSSARAANRAQDDRLAACALVVRISDHQYEQTLRLVSAATAMTNLNYVTASTKIDQATDHQDSWIAILDDNGYEYLDDVWQACSPAYQVL